MDDYLSWCRRYGFGTNTDKSAARMRQELALCSAIRAQERLRLSRSAREPVAVIGRVCAGELAPEDIAPFTLREVAQRVADAFATPAERLGLREFLTFVGKTGGLITECEETDGRDLWYVDALIALHARRDDWLRPYREWRPRSHNRRRRLGGLIRFLLTRYDLPKFFDTVWLRRDRRASKYRDWYVHIGRGGSPRAGPVPAPLTRRAMHHFMHAPAHYTIEQAVRWGQVHALGGDERLCQALIATRLGRLLANDEFWQSVIRFFVRYPELDRAQVGPIVDYLQDQRFTRQRIVVETGEVATLPAPQPNLSMHRRTPESLLRRVDAWHLVLGKTRADDGMRWRPSGIRPLKLIVGKGERRKVWYINELLSQRALVREGQAMRHCVASYASQCRDRFTSIWSMTTEEPSGRVKRRLTIEVSRCKAIVQCRRRMNRLPCEQERRVLAEWAKLSGLRISPNL